MSKCEFFENAHGGLIRRGQKLFLKKAVVFPFLLFLCESIDKFRKRVHNKFGKMNIGIFRNTALRMAQSTEERGENPRRRNGTVKVRMFFPFGANAPVTRKKSGKALRKGRAAIRRTAPSQDIRFQPPLLAFPKEQSMQCIKMFAPKFEKNFGAFLLQDPAKGVPPSFFTE